MNMLDTFVAAQDCPTCGATYGEPCRRMLLGYASTPVPRMHTERHYAHWDAWNRMHENEEQAASHWIKLGILS